MKRNAFAMKLKEGKRAAYGALLGENWKELTAQLDAAGFSNFSIWNADDLLFGYCECADGHELTEEQWAYFRGLNDKFAKTCDWISEMGKPMRLMYEDFGVVRESKELIRHRVFMTKLVPGMEEEYKARHDALVEARNGQITQGPDSNFSIWNAGGYIFGYDEIDTTMERERTQADDDADIAWETRMLEIMSWVTDDVDWITKEHHEHVKRICWHG